MISQFLIKYFNPTHNQLPSIASARLIAGFSLIGISASSVALILIVFFDGFLPASSDRTSLTIACLPVVVSIAAFLLSRTRYFAVGGGLLIFGAFVSLVGQIITNPNVEIVRAVVAYFYLIPLLCSLVFGWTLTTVVTLCCLVALGTVKKVVPDFKVSELNIQCISLFAGAGLAIIGSYLRRTAEKEMELQRAKLTASARLSALGEMSAGMAHEINNPLMVIFGRVALLRNLASSKKVDLESISKDLDLIEKMGSTIGKIVSSLRTFARDGALDELETTAVGEIIEDCLILCQERFKADLIEFFTEVPPGEILFACRRVQLCQVLVNLLNNAYDAIKGSSLRWIRLSVRERESEIEFSVMDSGNKIPVEVQAKLFQPFFTTKDLGKGTGLGLSISLGIVESHGGKLWLDSQSKNTRFVVTLPRVQRMAYQSERLGA